MAASSRKCYVSQPFGRKPGMIDGREAAIDFDAIYYGTIKPVIEHLGYQCFRGDDGPRSGVIHKRMLQAVLESDVMIADLSTKNPNVIYDLGIRHAVQRGRTYLIGNQSAFPLPFNINNLFVQRYNVQEDGTLSGDQAYELRQLLNAGLEEEVTASPLHEYFPELKVDLPREPCVFIGHGRNRIWAQLQLHLEKELKLKTVNYETESRVGESIVTVLEQMMAEATFAILIMTGEDDTASGAKRARQNVIHEIGLFHGKLGFRRVVLLLQKGVEEFSNVAGLQHIAFEGDGLDSALYPLRRVLEREGLIGR